MKRLARQEAWEVWERFWDEANEEFFKVEALQDYSAEENAEERSETLDAWLAGNKERSRQLLLASKNEWAEQTSSKPIRKIRIHIIDTPYTDYLQWEIEHYKLVNIPQGKEEVFLVNRADIPDYDLGDFMMFDERYVTHSHYDQNGLMQSMDIYESEDITPFKVAKTLLLKHAQRLEP